MGKQNQLQKKMARVEEYMTKVRARHGQDAAAYLGFDTTSWGSLKFSGNVTVGGYDGCQYIGEWAAQTDKPSGRGIQIANSGWIDIVHFKDGQYAAGPIITIFTDGTFRVGEWYVNAKNVLRERGTAYYADGTSNKYD